MEAEAYTRKRGGRLMALWSIPSATSFWEACGFLTASINVEFLLAKSFGKAGLACLSCSIWIVMFLKREKTTSFHALLCFAPSGRAKLHLPSPLHFPADYVLQQLRRFTLLSLLCCLMLRE